MVSKEVATKNGSGRTSILQQLMKSREGKQRIEELLTSIQLRASLPSACLAVGLKPSTVAEWIRRGGREKDSIYSDFAERFWKNVGLATTSAEMELNEQSPKSYLSRGYGRVVLNDLYNLEGDGTNTYELDGTISKDGKSQAELVSEQPDDNSNTHNTAIEDTDTGKKLIIDALIALRESGQDLNTFIDREISKRKIQDDTTD